MPRKSKMRTTRARRSTSSDPSYDTKMIITILLLLFMYPLGLIFMFVWMKTWPTWLKVVLTLPLIISILFLFVIFYFIGSLIRASVDRNGQNVYIYRYQRSAPDIQRTIPINISPIISPYKTY